jgi:hypothetical protein
MDTGTEGGEISQSADAAVRLMTNMSAVALIKLRCKIKASRPFFSRKQPPPPQDGEEPGRDDPGGSASSSGDARRWFSG